MVLTPIPLSLPDRRLIAQALHELRRRYDVMPPSSRRQFPKAARADARSRHVIDTLLGRLVLR